MFLDPVDQALPVGTVRSDDTAPDDNGLGVKRVDEERNRCAQNPPPSVSMEIASLELDAAAPINSRTVEAPSPFFRARASKPEPPLISSIKAASAVTDADRFAGLMPRLKTQPCVPRKHSGPFIKTLEMPVPALT